MKILLTGGSGQVGHELRRSLQGLGEIIAPGRAQMDLSDSRQVRQLIRLLKPNLIINAAAYTDVDRAEHELALAMRINGEAPGVMAEEAQRLGAAMIHYSSDYVFDGAKRNPAGELEPYTEQDAPNPINVYGKTKLAGEQAIAASGCAWLILRTSWVYSMHGKNFLLTMLRLARERDTIKVVDDQWGAPTWAGWVANATARMIKSGLPRRREHGERGDMDADDKRISAGLVEHIQLHGGICNVANAGTTTWNGFAQEIFLQAAATGQLNEPAPAVRCISTGDYPALAMRPVNSMLSLHALSSRLGMQPPEWQHSLMECLKQN